MAKILAKGIERQRFLSSRSVLYYRILWLFNLRILDLRPGWLMGATAEGKSTMTSS